MYLKGGDLSETLLRTICFKPIAGMPQFIVRIIFICNSCDR